jgi:hypothetical protein
VSSIQPNPNHNERAAVKQMVGEAQRIAQRTGRTGDIEVVKEVGFCGSNYQAQILVVYNTHTTSYHVKRQ